MHFFDASIQWGFAYIFCIPFCGISQNFSPSVLFSRNSRTSLTTSARKCTSLNLSLTGCLGPNYRMSCTNFGSSRPSIITTLLWEPFRSDLSCLSGSLSSFPLSLFWTIAEWFLISRLMQLTTDGISSVFTFSLKLLLSVSSCSLNTLRPFSARFISCFRSFNWKLCTACSEKFHF